MTPRRLVPVILDGSVETAHSIPPPRVGGIATYAVGFVEADQYTDPDDPALTTISARVEPLRGGRPRRNTRHDGTPFEQPDRWASWLHADGWSALWVSFRLPPTGPGPVELRGRVVMDFPALCSCWVRGRVTRLWMTYARRDRPAVPGERGTWGPVWGSQGRIELEDWPTTVEGWPELPPGATESGRLVELDLDGVPDGSTGGVHR